MSSQVAIGLLVFIDASIDDYQRLVNGVASGAKVIVIDSQRDGVAQITETLRDQQVDNIHIISHGAPGILYLGNAQLSLDTLEQYAWDLQSWSSASIRLYGYNVAAGDVGAEFIRKLRCLTGATITASNTLSGN